MSTEDKLMNNGLTIKEVLNTKTTSERTKTCETEVIEDKEEDNCITSGEVMFKKNLALIDNSTHISVNDKLKPIFGFNVEPTVSSSQSFNNSLSIRTKVLKNPLSDCQSFLSSALNNCGHQSIPLTYFDPLSIDSKQLVSVDENQTNDIEFLIRQEIYDSKEELLKTLKEIEERFAEYLEEKEIKFLNALEKAEERIDREMSGIATDVKAIRVCIEEIENQSKKCYSEFDSKFEVLQNDNQTNHRSFQDCITTLLEIDSKLKDKQNEANQVSEVSFMSKQFNNKYFSSNEMKAICEPITIKLAKELQSIIRNTFDDYQRTIINGDRKRSDSFNKCSDVDHSEQSLKWSTYDSSGNKDRESIRSEALEMLNSGNIRDCFAIALNLGEPEFITHLCTVFEKSPQKLITELEKCHDSQTIFVSLLDQLFRDGVVNKRWKIHLIEMLMVRIDMDNKTSKDCVPKLAKHWSAIMEQISQRGGDFSQRAKLMAISFKFLSEEFNN